MNNNQIPGEPEGWKLVKIDRPTKGDWFIDVSGQPKQYPYDHNCGGVFPIIRKIEKPAAYRPFANASEADQFWNVALRYRSSLAESKHSRFRINTIGLDGITIGLEFYSYKAAFDRFCVDDDGIPFGVRIDE
jgi:hypothetical protein